MALPAMIKGRAGVRLALVDEIVASLPASTYRELAWPGETVAACLRALDRSRRDDNPRAIREWIDYQRHAPGSEHLIACLDATISKVAVSDLLDRSGVAFLRRVREDAIRHLNEKSVDERIAGAITTEQSDLVDGLVRAVAAYD